MAGLLEGKVALITGASSGIGRASVLAFSREGARIVASDVATRAGEALVQTIRDSGGEAVFVQADVTKSDEVKALISKAVETYGRVDCAFNNAGIEGAVALTHDYPEEDWDRVIDINLRGVWLCMKHEIPRMLEQGKGAIVNTSSGGGLVGSPRMSAYGVSKHGVTSLTKTAALEYGGAGIRVNAVCPGLINTPMMERIEGENPRTKEQVEGSVPQGRLGTPEEVAEAVVWLSSDAASYINGTNMLIDGGMRA